MRCNNIAESGHRSKREGNSRLAKVEGLFEPSVGVGGVTEGGSGGLANPKARRISGSCGSRARKASPRSSWITLNLVRMMARTGSVARNVSGGVSDGV